MFEAFAIGLERTLGPYSGGWQDFFQMIVDFITSDRFKELLQFIISLFG